MGGVTGGVGSVNAASSGRERCLILSSVVTDNWTGIRLTGIAWEMSRNMYIDVIPVRLVCGKMYKII